jgi:hypothetical protein
MKFRCKISLDEITYGPKTEEVDDVTVFTISGGLIAQGYRKVSNAFCRVAKIDRDDWVQVLATQLNCAPADFYKMDGSGISDRWRDHYVRMHSKKVLTVHPDIVRKIPSF